MISRCVSAGVTLGLLAAGAIGVATHPGFASRVTAGEARLQQMAGVEFAVAGIYLEESAIPMPVPSEVSIGYLGQRLNGNPLGLAATWIALSALILLGSTNLFAASRRFGPRLVSSRLGTALHLTPAAVARAQQWFERWGPLAIGVSRYIPGLRWGMAVACGTLGISYRTFWVSTVVSATIWAGGLLMLGFTMGNETGRIIGDHAWIGLLLPLPAGAVVTTALVRLLLHDRSRAARTC